ncbi:MAG: cupredoxin domain-containing protein [Actinomycetes bacterium]
MYVPARTFLRYASLAVVTAATLAACAPVGDSGGMGSGGMGGMGSGGMGSGGMGGMGSGAMGELGAGGGTPDRGDGHGDSAASPPIAGARGLAVEAGELFFTPRQLRIDAGEPVNLTVANTGEAFHDFMIADLGFMLDLAAGTTATAGLTIDRPGEYQFRCTVPGHAAAGMRGTLIVEYRPR